MSNVTEYKTPSAEDFKQRVVNTVKNTMMGLIPDDELEKMIEKEIHEFFFTEREYTIKQEVDPNNRGYTTNYINVLATKITPFRQLVWGTIRDQVTENLREYLENKKEEIKAEMVRVLESPTAQAIERKGTITFLSEVQEYHTLKQLDYMHSMLNVQLGRIRQAFPNLL